MLEEMLKNHLQKKAELAFRKLDIEEIEQRINYHNLVYVEALEECLEGEVMKAATLSDMPKSITNKFSSSTENAALNYNTVYENKVDIVQLKIDKANTERQIAPLQREVDTVEALLKCLNDKEKFVIDLHCIRQYTIPETVQRFASEFGYGSQTNVKELKQKALSKMESIYNKKSA
jgi:DNA-directed RNA polymerase sigma subunit (sigma70/sigma32)